MNQSAMSHARASLRAMPRGIWALGFVSLFMDVSSETIHSLLPVFLVSVLGASVATVGWLEGIAEAIAAMTKIFSGTLSDKLRKRKALAVAGYGLAALTKPLFALAPAVGWVFAARFLDRVGKGIRGAPRDALVADLVSPANRGAAYGLRQALDTVGAFAGPLLAIALMAATGDSFRFVFWIAVAPAVVSVLLLLAFVDEREPAQPADGSYSFRLALRTLGGRYWWLVVVAGLFTLARFSEAFLVLKASDAGLGNALVPLVLVVMNLSYALSAYPAGFISDRLNRWGVLAFGSALLVLADLVLAFSGSVAMALIGIAIWGLHMGFTQGLFAALVADSSRGRERGTAFGIFNFVSGLMLLGASVIAGQLWDSHGPRATFLVGAGLTGAAGVVAVVLYLAGRLPTDAAWVSGEPG
jgi:MFS family permease